MSNQFRLYYECYEQAFHFLIPALMAIKPEAEITLIKISSIKDLASPNPSQIAENICDSLFMKNPDALFTQITEDNIENGLLWLEMSVAVMTKDHDLQRFDSIYAAAASKIPFAKMWAKKSSSKDHGGQKNYDQKDPFKISKQLFDNIAVEIEWPISEDKLSALRDSQYKACPPKSTQLHLTHLLSLVIEGNEKHSNPSFYLSENLKTEIWLQSQINDYSQPINIIYPNSSTRLYKFNNLWHLKFNRWVKAMDPERGMSFFYRHYLNTLLVGTLIEKKITSSINAINNFSQATGIKLNSSLGQGPHDITKQINGSVVNRSGLAILLNCRSFEIYDNKKNLLVSFFWSPPDLKNIIKNRIKVGSQTSIKAYNKITEDEVTYAIAFGVYPSNGFTIESVSYPGAQGDKALMEGTGKNAKRTYIDVVAVKSVTSFSIISLTESKGDRTRKKLTSDIEKIISWKNVISRKTILLNTYQLPKNSIILNSIAYPGSTMVNIPICSQLDFCVTFNNDEWVIWTKAATIPQGFSKEKLKGKVKFLNRFSY